MKGTNFLKQKVNKSVFLRLFSFLLILVIIGNDVTAQERPSSTGTGFLINENGWILTNEHVVRGCQYIDVQGLGSVDRKIVDVDNDVAAIKLVTKPNRKPIPIATKSARVGQDVIALGYPLTGLLSQSVKLTKGVINSLSGLFDDDRYMQISAAIQNGNSGGPLLNDRGYAIGLVTAKLNERKLQQIDVYTENVNFALHAKVAIEFLENNLIEYVSSEYDGPILSTEAIAEEVSSSTFLISCFGEDEVSDTPAEPPVQSSAYNWYLAGYNGIDFWGGDKQPSGLPTGSLEECEATCAADLSCRAFTFNIKSKTCFPKQNIEFIVRTDGAISGVFFQNQTAFSVPEPLPLISQFISLPGQEFTGMLWPFSQPSGRLSSIDQCLRFCAADAQCSSVTYDPRETGNANCKVRRLRAGSLRRNGKATSFQRVEQRVLPSGPIIPLNVVRHAE